MTTKQQLNLGTTAQALLASIPEFMQKRPSIFREDPAEIAAFETAKEAIYAKFDALAKESLSDFRALLCAEDLMKISDPHQIYLYTNQFFVEYLNSKQERKDTFLNNCTKDDLATYVENNLWCLGGSHLHKHKSTRVYCDEFKQVTSHLYDVIIQNKYLPTEDADKLLSLVIDCMIHSCNKRYSFLSLCPDPVRHMELGITRRHDAYCFKQIASMLKHISNVDVDTGTATHSSTMLRDVLYHLNDHKRNKRHVKALIYELVDRGAKITGPGEYGIESLIFPIYAKLFGDDNETQNFIRYALDQNSQTPRSIVEKALRAAIVRGNDGAIRALFFYLLLDTSWTANKLQFIDMLFTSDRRIGNKREQGVYTRLDGATVQGILSYLALNNVSVSDMLEQVAEKFGAETLQTVIKKLFYTKVPFNPDPRDISVSYVKHEEGEDKNVLYYLAKHPEICAQLDAYFYKAYATVDMIIKSDPELCPLTLALNTQNVAFLLFVVKVIGSKANQQLSIKIIDAVLKFMEQNIDITSLVTHLEDGVQQHARPFRWISLEYNLLSAIQTKVAALKPVESKSSFMRLLWQFSGAARNGSVTTTNTNREAAKPTP